MCKGLEALGHDVTFACRKTPPEHAGQPETIEKKCREYGINYTTEISLNRYFGFKDTLNDLIKLPAYIWKNKIEVVHSHLSHDHALGLYAAKFSLRHPVLVKSMHRRNVLADKFWNRRLLKGLAGRNGLVVFTQGFKNEYAERFNIPLENIGICPMTLDLARFNQKVKYVDQRKHFNIPKGRFLIGIVARFQKYRRMDIFMAAAAQVIKQNPNAHFLVIGRSSQIQETVIKPMKALGLEEHVTLPGYLMENYVDTIASLDAFTLMIPGFDGTARAMREAMALGKPCVVSDIGMLPEIVEHGKSGLVFSFKSAESLAEAWLRLIDNPEERQTMGQYAANYAREHFRMESVGPALESFYQKLLVAK
jgi:glycosyltransferase involved in cell wall biosynthesis